MSQNRRILYVDDDAALRRLVERALQRRGFTVVTAEDADAALAALRREPFDLVSVDHHMPGKDGLALLADIAQLAEAPPVVFVTGTDDTRVAVAALKAGAADFVIKAVGEDFFDLLANAFEQALERVALLKAKARAEDELRAANARLEALLGEVHHRVANSLQLVSTFALMQRSQTRDPTAAEALTEILRRIQAVSQVHRSLYTSSDAETIALDTYLETLLDAVRQSLSDDRSAVQLHFAAQPVAAKPDQAVSIGVLVTELVSNAVKYAYPDGETGTIQVELTQSPQSGFRVEVWDDGQGFVEGEVKGTGLGMRIVKAMARGLKSEVVRLPRTRGTHFAVAVAV